VLYHSAATAHFMYVRDCAVDAHLLDLVGLPREETVRLAGGCVCPGSSAWSRAHRAHRPRCAGRGGRAAARPSHRRCTQKNIAVFPIAREGLKYQVAEALQSNHGYYCDEVVLDAHHVFDSSVPVYNRKVELTVFKDKDLNQGQRRGSPWPSSPTASPAAW